MRSLDVTQKNRVVLINRMMYMLFIVIGVYFLVSRPSDWISGLSDLALAMIFDPFDQSIPWAKRPVYQRVWLYVHLSILIILLLIFLFMIK